MHKVFFLFPLFSLTDRKTASVHPFQTVFNWNNLLKLLNLVENVFQQIYIDDPNKYFIQGIMNDNIISTVLMLEIVLAVFVSFSILNNFLVISFPEEIQFLQINFVPPLLKSSFYLYCSHIRGNDCIIQEQTCDEQKIPNIANILLQFIKKFKQNLILKVFSLLIYSKTTEVSIMRKLK